MPLPPFIKVGLIVRNRGKISLRSLQMELLQFQPFLIRVTLQLRFNRKDLC